MKSLVLLVGVLSFALLSSCSDSCETGEVDILGLEDLGCANPTYELKLLSNNEFEFIRNQSQFDELIVSSCDASIDWVNHDLIVGMARLTNGLSNIDKELVRDCKMNRLNLTFTISTNASLNAPEISFNALIPKVDNTEGLFVKIVKAE
jgi:hypothetical protein